MGFKFPGFFLQGDTQAPVTFFFLSLLVVEIITLSIYDARNTLSPVCCDKVGVGQGSRAPCDVRGL